MKIMTNQTVDLTGTLFEYSDRILAARILYIGLCRQEAIEKLLGKPNV